MSNKTVKITAPWPVTGTHATVDFVKGEATLPADDPKIAYFQQAGYSVDGDIDTTDAPQAPEKPVTKMTKDELIALAAQKGILVADRATKDDIIALLNGRDAADANEPATQAGGAPVVGTGQVSDESSTPPEGTVFGATPAAADGDNEDATGAQV